MEKTLTPSHTCPWWLLFTFDNRFRRLVHDPIKILTLHVQSGATVLDIGCGMGYFTLPLAQLVGPKGGVIAVDVQHKMLEGLRRRAERAGLMDRIRILHCAPDRIGLDQRLDFALAFWMVHEVKQPEPFLKEIYDVLKPGGGLLLVEPKIHVSRNVFENTVVLAQNSGYKTVARPMVWGSRSTFFLK